MRRVDADGDDMISFSDFFSGLLPYFIYGEVQVQKSELRRPIKDNSMLCINVIPLSEKNIENKQTENSLILETTPNK